jgi:hypothetical protein
MWLLFTKRPSCEGLVINEEIVMYTSVPPALISASLLALAGLFGGVSISFLATTALTSAQ